MHIGRVFTDASAVSLESRDEWAELFLIQIFCIKFFDNFLKQKYKFVDTSRLFKIIWNSSKIHIVYLILTLFTFFFSLQVSNATLWISKYIASSNYNLM